MRNLAIVLEAIGIMAIIVGASLEAILHAPIGFITISSGSAIVALGSLIWAKLIKGR